MGKWTRLPTGWSFGTATHVNDQGQVLGSLTSPPGYGPDQVLVWDGDETILPPANADVVGMPGGINNQGQVAVNVEVDGDTRAAIWEVGGDVTELGTLGGPTSRVVAINEAGQVLGNSITASGKSHAFLWSDGEMVDLGTLAGEGTSWAVDINDSGQVLGTLVGGAPYGRAVLWTVPTP